MLSVCQLIGAFSGNYFANLYGYAKAISYYIYFGLLFFLFYGIFGCGLKYRIKYIKIKNHVLRHE